MLSSVWVHLESFFLQESRCEMGRTGAINAKVSAMKLRWNFFATNAPHPPHWTLNSCFVVFCSVWMHLGPFCYCMKLGAKWANLVQLMQKFVPRSRVGIFRTNTLDPSHWTLNSCFVAFQIVWVHWGPFRNCRKLGANWPKLVQLMRMFVPRSRIESFGSEHTRSSP